MTPRIGSQSHPLEISEISQSPQKNSSMGGGGGGCYLNGMALFGIIKIPKEIISKEKQTKHALHVKYITAAKSTVKGKRRPFFQAINNK